MKKLQKIFLTLVLVSVVCLTAGILLVGNNQEDGEISVDNSLKVVEMASTKTQLTPILKYRYVLPSSPEVQNEFIVLNNNSSNVYNGQGNLYDFKVTFKEGVEGLNPTISTFKKDQDGVYQPLSSDYKIRNVGEYKVVVELNDAQYELKPDSNEFFFKIIPFECGLKQDPITKFVYTRTPHSPVFEADVSVTPDSILWTSEIYAFDSSINDYVLIDEKDAINVGKYKFKMKCDSENYIITNKVVAEGNEFIFNIYPAPLYVRPILQESYIYANEDKHLDLDKTSVLGIVDFGGLKDEVNITYNYLYSNKEINIENQATSNIKDAGIYTIQGTSDNPNYIVKDSQVEIYKKDIDVLIKVPTNLVYDGTSKEVEILYGGIYPEDNVTISPTYNGKKDKPINAGKYEVSAVVEGERKFNYKVKHDIKNLVIEKAEYPVESFEVEIHAIKVIVIVDDFKHYDVRFSIDGENWQKDAKITAKPMQDYTVYVKILEDINHFEKVLTKEVRTGFDPTLFSEYMAKIDIDNFSFKDIETYEEIIRCEDYITQADKASVDYDKLNKIKAAYLAFQKDTQEVLDDALEIRNSIKFYYVAPIAAGVIGISLMLRRRRHEK